MRRKCDEWRLVSYLNSHDLTTGLMNHFIDRAVGPSADLTQVLQVLGSEVPVLLGGNLQLPTRLDTVITQPLSVPEQSVCTSQNKCKRKTTDKLSDWRTSASLTCVGYERKGWLTRWGVSRSV